MAKKLKLYNGRAYYCRTHRDARWENVTYGNALTAFIAAYSIADASRVIAEYTGYDRSNETEIKLFWSECWGRSMNGITPERGLWIEFEYNKPVRVL